jgi:hypothetical protein
MEGTKMSGDDTRVRLGAGFKWVSVRKIKKGNVQAAGRLLLEVTAATNTTAAC